MSMRNTSKTKGIKMVKRNFHLIERLGNCEIYRRVVSDTPNYVLAYRDCCGDYIHTEFSLGDMFFYREDEFVIQHESTAKLTPLEAKKLDLAKSLGYKIKDELCEFYVKEIFGKEYLVINDELKYKECKFD